MSVRSSARRRSPAHLIAAALLGMATLGAGGPTAARPAHRARLVRSIYARHEAAHAVVAHLLGCEVRAITVDPRQAAEWSNDPRTWATSARVCPDPPSPQREVQIAMAGCEYTSTGTTATAQWQREICADDMRWIEDQGLPTDEVLRLSGVTRVLVQEHRQVILAVARELEARRTLSGLAFRSIVARR
jgi:hypothetical protein